MQCPTCNARVKNAPGPLCLKCRVAELEGLLRQAYNHIDTHYDDARQVAFDIAKSLNIH